ncbi:MBL fold metallo-hydrolase [Baaleninema simplex]|uniref:MBL fold metallo-hydrolase n=1 Tax=Baaleninema simplex TaxID=2862350 RepID=UPI00034558A1|nr:MBL fold metallo-hydrolase [Baaleninema simplex]
MIQHLEITVLVENTAWGRGLLGEHGLSWWIEADGHRILFDTGQGYVLKHNAERLQLPLDSLEAIALSHGHDDHAGGLSEVLSICGDRLDLYLHPESLKQKYSPRGEISAPLRDVEELQHRVKRLVITAEPTEIVPGVWLTGTVPRRHPLEDTGGAFWNDAEHQEVDELLDDRTLFVETPKGIVVVLGCAHAGIINILDYIRELTQSSIYAVMGGMHLLRASEERLAATVETLTRYDIQHIGANHCTGTKAIARLWEHFGDRCFDARVGTRFEARS